MELVNHSYKDDCIFLLKDLTNTLREITVDEKEELIKAGVSYSKMISKESKPSEAIKKIFLDMTTEESKTIAYYVAKLSEIIYKEKGDKLVLVSLARAGTPYGILIRKYLKFKYEVEIPHYSISIIRGKGIDYNALQYILKNHSDGKLQFIDGWTGKGSITKELDISISYFNKEFKVNIDKSLAVLADPAKLCRIYGTREDIAIPNCCLNATVSGLISRTVLNEDYIGPKDFHGAKYLDYLEDEDLSQYYVDRISSEFQGLYITIGEQEEVDISYSREITQEIMEMYSVKSVNSIKLSIGEAARVLLRRKARIVLVKDIKDKNLKHIIQLAKEKNIEVKEYKDSEYRCIAIIEEDTK